MKFKQPFKIEIDKNCSHGPEDEPESTYGKITIGDFYENFYMSPSVWPIHWYEQQWKLALQKIKTEKKSCFVQNIQDNPLIFLWTIYKDPSEKKLYIRNALLNEEEYDKRVKNVILTPHNIFDVINHERTLEINEPEPEDEFEKRFWNIPPSEWAVEYED